MLTIGFVSAARGINDSLGDLILAHPPKSEWLQNPEKIQIRARSVM